MVIDEEMLDIRYTPGHKVGGQLQAHGSSCVRYHGMVKISAAFGQQDKVVLEVRFLIFHLLGSIPATKLYSLSQHVV
jgi:hypothetical protein